MKKYNNSRGFYVYGKNAVAEILEGSPEKIVEVFFVQDRVKGKAKELKGVDQIVSLAKSGGVRMTSIESKRAERMLPGVLTQNVIAYYTGFEYTAIGEFMDKHAENPNSCVLVLDGVEDVQNFGAIIRSAVAVGVDGIFVSDFHQAPVNGGTFKTSAGTIGKIDIIQFSGMGQLMEELKKSDYWMYGIDMPDLESIDEYAAGDLWQQKFDARTALILGGEGKGISEKAKEKCDFLAPIPMESGVESLNVSVAAAVAMYEWKRQQSKG